MGRMLASVRHWFRLKRLQNKKEQIRREYDEIYNTAKKDNKSHNELQSILGITHGLTDQVDDAIHVEQTYYLIDLAENYLIPIPEMNLHDGNWDQSQYTNNWFLNQSALSELRSRIRQEQRERREHWQSWLASLTGVIGALIGLVALFVR